MTAATQAEPTLRPATPADEAALVALWQACKLTVWYNDPVADIARWRAQPDSSAILVLEQDGALLGSVAVGCDGHRGWVYYVAVAPDRQRQGLGERLMTAAEDFVRARGIQKLQLMVRPSNARVAAFYRQLGYEETPRRIFARWLQPLPTPTDPLEGKLRSVITYLEMKARPALKPVPPPPGIKLALLRAETPGVAFYRFLYNTVGKPWLWWARRAMSDEALARAIQDPKVEIYVLYCEGQPAGYAELDRRVAGEVELAYFGLLPDFIGRKLGPYLLTWALEQAWSYAPDRVWVNTCTFDHPKALPLYQKLGFVPYRQETQIIDDPRISGLIEG